MWYHTGYFTSNSLVLSGPLALSTDHIQTHKCTVLYFSTPITKHVKLMQILDYPIITIAQLAPNSVGSIVLFQSNIMHIVTLQPLQFAQRVICPDLGMQVVEVVELRC